MKRVEDMTAEELLQEHRIGAVLSDCKFQCERWMKAEAEILRRIEAGRKATEALREIEIMVRNLPGGVDEEADPFDQSPEDMTAHIGGLIWKLAKSALEGK